MSKVSIHNFFYDSNLFFVIQSVSNDSTEDILSYFLDMSLTLAIDAAKNSKASIPQKRAVLFYKDTRIPYKLHVWQRGEHFNADLKFPMKRSVFSESRLENTMAELAIGINDVKLPNFSAPRLSCPHILKHKV